MWTPSESDSVPPLREPRAWKCDDHQHMEQSRILAEKMNLEKSRRLEEGERNCEMDSAAMAKLDRQDFASSSNGSATAVIRTTTEKEHNKQIVRSVETLATPHNAVEVVPNLLSSLMNLLTINIADHNTKPEITINLKYEITAPNRDSAINNAIAELRKAQSKGKENIKGVIERSFAQASKLLIPKEASAATKGVPKNRKTLRILPPNAAQQDPSVLLAYMRPQTSYVDLGSCYDTKSLSFIASITVDGIVFEGQGSSKKTARKVAAALACRELFGVVSDIVVLD